MNLSKDGQLEIVNLIGADYKKYKNLEGFFIINVEIKI